MNLDTHWFNQAVRIVFTPNIKTNEDFANHRVIYYLMRLGHLLLQEVGGKSC